VEAGARVGVNGKTEEEPELESECELDEEEFELDDESAGTEPDGADTVTVTGAVTVVVAPVSTGGDTGTLRGDIADAGAIAP
jgi:hypothetical protein